MKCIVLSRPLQRSWFCCLESHLFGGAAGRRTRFFLPAGWGQWYVELLRNREQWRELGLVVTRAAQAFLQGSGAEDAILLRRGERFEEGLDLTLGTAARKQMSEQLFRRVHRARARNWYARSGA